MQLSRRLSSLGASQTCFDRQRRLRGTRISRLIAIMAKIAT